ncbi:ExeM/NucH family extracellular endonuclease [Shewanella corallii]|uniref:ExeM/NucH family extracellular endonuclease n=1 Tax=Shewanella corallii TaxID=560080 RepID=A0ABT0NBB9_9GAMM|nr:ExeM/NucH family extracellular endonuclease [Shewanella corallii]MCL2915410.1 ExeM/NucH family extracellular endonuclease [Shewanella corallii]
MKKSILSLAVASIVSAGAHAGVKDLLITEMVQKEGDAGIGSVEITNTHATEDFTFTDETRAVIHSNGKYDNDMKKADGSLLLTGVTIPAGKSLVLLNKGASDSYKDEITKAGGIHLVGEGNGSYSDIYFSGNDGFVLEHGGAVIDRVGAKGDSGVWAADSTLRRRVNDQGEVPGQAKDFDAIQWLEINPANLTGMGSPELAPKAEIFVCENLTNISVIQGEGHVSPLKGEKVVVQGIVTAVAKYPTQGFYMRDLISDGNPLTSDGIFVYTKGDTAGLKGKTVCLQSEVKEFYGLTQLSPTSWEITDDNFTATDAVDIEVLESDQGVFANTLERYEGMLVRLPEDMDLQQEGKQDMRVTKTFGFNYDSFRNNMTLSYLRPNFQPNQLNVAGSPESIAAREQNDDYRLIVESADKAPNGKIPYYPDFYSEPERNYIRIDDSVVGMEGVINYSYGDYSLTVTNTLSSQNFVHNLKRTDAPELSTEVPKDHFDITVAAQNLFNYFNSPFGGDQNNFGQNRGADNYEEYVQQKTKLVEAIRGLDADILGLMEMENNGFGLDSAIADLVNEVNTFYNSEWPEDYDKPYSTENRYVFVGFDHNGNQILDELDSIGSDAIATGIIYRPSKVSIERTRVIAMPQQKAPSIVNDLNEVIKDDRGEALENGQNYNRDALVVTFIVNGTGKRLSMAVNHFKSKGSTCWEDWQGVEFGDATVWEDDPEDLDAQGSCEHFRVAAAYHLGKEMEKLPGDKIILGDLNSYAQEDAMLVLTDNPRNKTLTTASYTYIDKKPQFNTDGSPVNITKSYGYIDSVALKSAERGETGWSYSYNDEVGSLDYILISPSLSDRLLDATDWHINAPEASLYDYNQEYKGDSVDHFYQPGQFRSSDHDPAIISLSYKPGETDPGKELRLPLWDKLMTAPYQIPESVEVMAGDIAHINLTPEDDEERLDLTQLVLPSVVIKQDGQQLVQFEVFGAPEAAYYADFSLRRNGEVVPGSEQSVLVEVKKRDTLVPSLVTEPHDSTGGATGLFGLLTLLGLTGLRRRWFKA